MVKNYTIEEIKEMSTNWQNYPGFTGDQCCSCKKYANILGTLGWVCDCGQFNAQMTNCYQNLIYRPDMGPSREVIKKASGVGK